MYRFRFGKKSNLKYEILDPVEVGVKLPVMANDIS
jgi:hypothetical protein